MDLGKVFVENLIRKRKSRGFTQAQFSELVGLSIRGYQKYEQGESAPTPDIIDGFAKKLRCKPLELLSQAEDIKQDSNGLQEAIQILSHIDALPGVLRSVVLTIIFDDEQFLTPLRLQTSQLEALRKLRKVF